MALKNSVDYRSLFPKRRGFGCKIQSGTTILVDSTTATTRAKTQGSVDVLIALAGATGGALSGMVVAQSSYATLSLGGGALALLLIPFVVWGHSCYDRY